MQTKKFCEENITFVSLQISESCRFQDCMHLKEESKFSTSTTAGSKAAAGQKFFNSPGNLSSPEKEGTPGKEKSTNLPR